MGEDGDLIVVVLEIQIDRLLSEQHICNTLHDPIL